MRSIEPGQPVPPDGADVLVVEGLGAGLGGCDHPLNEIVYITLLAVNSGQRTVTEISPQSNCSSDVNVWKYVLTSLVNQVIAGAPNAGTYWGGVMLDEEDAYWTTPPGSVAAYSELNAYLQDLMVPTPGMSLVLHRNVHGSRCLVAS